MSSSIPNRSPFSNIPLFLDWYISLLLLSSKGSWNFSMYSGIQGSLLSGWCSGGSELRFLAGTRLMPQE